MSADVKQRMIRRVASEVEAGMTVNLGIGLPTRVIDYVDRGLQVCLHSENGIAGVGPSVAYENADRNLIDAGGAYRRNPEPLSSTVRCPSRWCAAGAST